MSNNFWDERYGSEEFIYGKEPNEYFKEKIQELPIGKALFPAEGEGRNAVYAAKLGWKVSAFDQSKSAKKKALSLAEQSEVLIDYEVLNMDNCDYQSGTFDALTFIYAHFPVESRRNYHRQLTQYLRKDGHIILEAFSKKHTENQKQNPNAGGPGDIDMLYDLEELKEDFEGFEFLEAYETKTELSEGEHHKGNATVIRILAQKK